MDIPSAANRMRLIRPPRKLHATFFSPLEETVTGRVALRSVGEDARPSSIYVISYDSNAIDFSHYAGVLVSETRSITVPASDRPSAIGVVPRNCSLNEGDIISIHPSGVIDVIYRRKSFHNDLFVTQRCNSRCLMCSQPPIENEDPSLLSECHKIIRLADKATPFLGITGGEPTMLGPELLNMISECQQRLPNTKLHLLTNARLLRNEKYAKELALAGRGNLTVAVPICSDIDSEHDFIVQVRQGFTETVRGILNLARYKLPIEIRVVIHKLNYERLSQIAEYIYRNLTFVRHVALMALEPVGFGEANIECLWIDPYDYQGQLKKAVRFLALRGIDVSVYNHQLCTVPKELWTYCRKSISDWKVAYLESCSGCAVKEDCGGLFESAISVYHSAYIKPL